MLRDPPRSAAREKLFPGEKLDLCFPLVVERGSAERAAARLLPEPSSRGHQGMRSHCIAAAVHLPQCEHLVPNNRRSGACATWK